MTHPSRGASSGSGLCDEEPDVGQVRIRKCRPDEEPVLFLFMDLDFY